MKIQANSSSDSARPSFLQQELTVLRAWFQLTRLPNLFTVPGDPIAGFFVAQWPFPYFNLRLVLPCAVSSLLLYMAGLISNDYFDMEDDRAERPDRPLPGGRANPRIAIFTALALAVTGIAIASCVGFVAAVTAATLAITITTYNMGLKHSPQLGPLNMGVCRGLSLLLGASAFGVQGQTKPLVILAAAGLTLYVSAVTRIAAKETSRMEVGPNRWRPATSLMTAFFMMSLFIAYSGRCSPELRMNLVAAAAAAAAAVSWALLCGRSLAGSPEPVIVAATIGRFLRGLMLVQAALCALGGETGIIVACALVLLWPAAALTGKWFYAS